MRPFNVIYLSRLSLLSHAWLVGRQRASVRAALNPCQFLAPTSARSRPSQRALLAHTRPPAVLATSVPMGTTPSTHAHQTRSASLSRALGAFTGVVRTTPSPCLPDDAAAASSRSIHSFLASAAIARVTQTASSSLPPLISSSQAAANGSLPARHTTQTIVNKLRSKQARPPQAPRTYAHFVAVSRATTATASNRPPRRVRSRPLRLRLLRCRTTPRRRPRARQTPRSTRPPAATDRSRSRALPLGSRAVPRLRTPAPHSRSCFCSASATLAARAPRHRARSGLSSGTAPFRSAPVLPVHTRGSE